MKITTQPQEDQQVKLTVEFEPDVLDEYKHRAARRLSGRVKIPGFRPGKAPYAVVVRQVGEGAILEEALDLLIDDKYSKIIDESGIHPYGPGSLENVSSMDPLTLEFIVPLQAEISLGDYRSIRRPYESPQVSEQEVEQFIDALRSQRAVLEPVDRPVEEGDVVTVKLSASRVSTEASTASDEMVLIREMSTPFLIEETGRQHQDEWPFWGFTKNLVGLSVDESKSFSYTYPEDTPYEMLKGVKAEYHVTIEEIKARRLPELDNDFAASIGEFASVDDLTDRIRLNLQLEALSNYNDEYDQAVLAEVVSQSEFRFPPQMVEDEIDSVINSLRNRLESQNQSLDLYLKARSMDMDDLREESKPVAESRLKNTLALMELAKQEEIKINEGEFEAEAVQTLNALTNSLPEHEARQLSSPKVYGNLMNNIMTNMLTSRAQELLRGIASEQKAEQVLEALQEEDEQGEIVQAPESAVLEQPVFEPEVEEATPVDQQPKD